MFDIKDLQKIELAKGNLDAIGGGWKMATNANTPIFINPDDNGAPKYFFTAMTPHQPDQQLYRQPFYIEAHQYDEEIGANCGVVTATLVKTVRGWYVLTQTSTRRGVSIILKEDNGKKSVAGYTWAKFSTEEMVRRSVTHLNDNPLPIQNARTIDLGTRGHNNARGFGIIREQLMILPPCFKVPLPPEGYEWMKVHDFGKEKQKWVQASFGDGLIVVSPANQTLVTAMDAFGNSILWKARHHLAWWRW